MTEEEASPGKNKKQAVQAELFAAPKLDKPKKPVAKVAPKKPALPASKPKGKSTQKSQGKKQSAGSKTSKSRAKKPGKGGKYLKTGDTIEW